MPGLPLVCLRKFSHRHTISTDNRLVYALDDMAIPAAPNMLEWLKQPQGAPLKQRVLQNVLSAFDVTNGKYVWKLGQWSVGDGNERSRTTSLPTAIS